MTAIKQVPDAAMIWPSGNSPAESGVFAQNVIEVRAKPETVWSLLVDCAKWPRWYRHCADVSILRDGSTLREHSKFRFKTLNLYFEPEVTVFEPQRMLVWFAKGPLGSSGAHAWRIEPIRDGCRVITEETQRGIPSRLLGWHTRKRLLLAHQDWLEGLKEMAEGG